MGNRIRVYRGRYWRTYVLNGRGTTRKSGSSRIFSRYRNFSAQPRRGFGCYSTRRGPDHSVPNRWPGPRTFHRTGCPSLTHRHADTLAKGATAHGTCANCTFVHAYGGVKWSQVYKRGTAVVPNTDFGTRGSTIARVKIYLNRPYQTRFGGRGNDVYFLCIASLSGNWSSFTTVAGGYIALLV